MQSVTRATSHSSVEDLAVQAKVCGANRSPSETLCRQDTFGSASIKGEQQSLREAFLTEGHESRTGVCKVILIVVRTQVSECPSVLCGKANLF